MVWCWFASEGAESGRVAGRVIFNGDIAPSEQFTVRDSEAGLHPIQVAGLWESRQQLIAR